MSKGSASRPLSIPREQYGANHDAIFAPQKLCGLCRESVQLCGCMAEDGPGQGSDEVKTHYERRRFDREGV